MIILGVVAEAITLIKQPMGLLAKSCQSQINPLGPFGALVPAANNRHHPHAPCRSTS
jgi:hypothetical protein